MLPTVEEVDQEIERVKGEKKVAIDAVTAKVADEVAAVRKEYDRKLARLRSLRRCVI